MKIVSWNVNGLRSVIGYSPWCHAKKHERLHAMLEFFESDIICFQETKITRAQLSTNLSTVKGYITFYSFCNTKSGYSGVSTHIRESATYLKPIKAQDGFTGLLKSNNPSGLITTNELLHKLKQHFSEQRLKQLDNEGRCLITQHHNFLLFNIYFPNGMSQDRLLFKTNYHQCIKLVIEYFIKYKKQNVILLGDMNAKYQLIDVCDKKIEAQEFYQRKSTEWFMYLVNDVKGLNMIDSFKYIHSDFNKLSKMPYTCWDTYTFARASNYGTRIDYILVNNEMINDKIKIVDAKVLQSVKGSDHCPIFCEIIGFAQDKNNDITIPKLASRFMPEFAGKQTNLMSFFSTKSNATNNSRKRKFDQISTNDSNSNNTAPKKQKLNHNANKSKHKYKPAKIAKNQSNLWGFVKKSNQTNASIETKENINTCTNNGNNTNNDKPKLVRQSSAEQWKILFAKKKPKPFCHHGEQCTLRTVTKNGYNRGKKFYTCPRGKGDPNDPNAQCNFFQWVDKPAKLKKTDSKKKPKPKSW